MGPPPLRWFACEDKHRFGDVQQSEGVAAAAGSTDVQRSRAAWPQRVMDVLLRVR